MILAILIVDMAGFSALCEAEGIDDALDVLEAHTARCRASVEAHGGTWVKTWADNFGALFPSVAQAHACAREVTADGSCSAGIGWGEMKLDRPPGDVWGVEVNRASRLGEDVAGPGEVLLTQAAMAEAL